MMKTNNTDTISASKLKAGTIDNKVAQRIKVYEFDNKLGCYTEHLANLTESQSYMAVEFEKMQEEMKELKEWNIHLQNNFRATKQEYNWLFANRLDMVDKSIDKVKILTIAWFVLTLVITILGAIYHK